MAAQGLLERIIIRNNYNHMVKTWLEYCAASSLAGMIKVNRMEIVGIS
jgi:hypothetical protein